MAIAFIANRHSGKWEAMSNLEDGSESAVTASTHGMNLKSGTMLKTSENGNKTDEKDLAQQIANLRKEIQTSPLFGEGQVTDKHWQLASLEAELTIAITLMELYEDKNRYWLTRQVYEDSLEAGRDCCC